MNMTSSNQPRVEVMTSPERHRRWVPAEKLAMVEETYAPGSHEEGAMSGIDAEDKVVPAAEVKKLQERIRRLERLLAEKTVDVEILKEAVRIGREKKLISRVPLVGVEISSSCNCKSARRRSLEVTVLFDDAEHSTPAVCRCL